METSQSLPDGAELPDDAGLRKRKGHYTNSADHEAAPKIITFNVEEITSVKTDFHKSDPLQNVVRFHAKSSRMVTGGTDAKVRVWKVY